MSVHKTKSRPAQISLPFDNGPFALTEIWDSLPSECQSAAMSVLAMLVARLRQPEELLDED